MKTPKDPKAAKRDNVTTTLRTELWKALQIQAIHEGRNANDILEELIEAYIKRKGSK